MSNFERTILPIIDPKIKLKPIQMEDDESSEAKENASTIRTVSNNPKISSRAGAYVPLIQINSTRFHITEISSFNLSLSKKIPVLNVTVIDKNHKLNVNYPLDGDFISIYLRPPDVTNQRPIRIDFDIVSIDSNPIHKIYTFNGIMKIPKIFKEDCIALKKDISFTHLQDICETLNIGFASNELNTDDEMTRICPYITYENFINETVENSYKDDDSFFDWYIDPYYYLCFVNVNKQFALEDVSDSINISSSKPISGMTDANDAEDSAIGNLILTNQVDKQDTNIYIENFSLDNKSGRTWIQNGYKRYVQYFDTDENTYQNMFIDPLTTQNSENDYILLKGNIEEDFYKEQNKYKWLGKQSSIINGGNCHNNYQFAKILNYQNIEEISKVSLKVIISGMNFYIYKYMRIPVLIYDKGMNKNATLRKRNDELGENYIPDENSKFNNLISENPYNPDPLDLSNTKNEVKNEFLSGYYIVKDIEYIYTKGSFIKQKLTLVRREWNIPGKHTNN